MGIMNYTPAGSTRIQGHFHSSYRRLTFKTQSSPYAQRGISLAYERNRRLWIAKDVGYSFKGEQQTLLQLGCNQHLRRSLNKDVILTKIRAKPFGIRDGRSSRKDELCRDFFFFKQKTAY